MPRASRFVFQKSELETINSHLNYLLSSLNDEKSINDFLNEFLTKEEKIMFPKRLVLFMMLKRNYPPHIIQSVLHISYETVRSYQNQLTGKSKFFHKELEKLINRENTKTLFQKIDKILKPFELALKSKSDMRARAKLLSHDY